MSSSLVARIHERYLDEDDEVDEDIVIQSFLSASPNKHGDQNSLQFVVLNHQSIDHIGDVNTFANLCRSVSEVDLAWNKIYSWRDVGVILQHLPQLRVFNVSHNRLDNTINDNDIPLCPSLKTLILNGTNLTVPSLRRFLKRMPTLRELHLSQNTFDERYFDSLAEGEPGPSGEGKENITISDSVNLIHLNRCEISRWSDALRMLSYFPKRETAFLCENPIHEIKEHKNEMKTEHHEYHPTHTLKMINLSKTNISDWESIEAFEEWPHLVDLRVNNIPLLDEYGDEEKLHLVVGRLDRLRLLNGSNISEEQRGTSERFFIRYYEEKNPRPRKYDSLLSKHGKLEKLVKVDLSPKTSAHVRVVCEETNYDKEIAIRLTRTVGQLMRHLEKLVGIGYERMRIFYLEAGLEEDAGYGPTELRFPKQVLWTLNIEDGARFTVQSKIVPNRKRTQTRSTSSSS